jgi:hypothetical protein
MVTQMDARMEYRPTGKLKVATPALFVAAE